MERAIGEWADIAIHAVAYERAMVRADERSIGAREAGDEVAAAARRQEAIRFGLIAANLNLAVGTSAKTLAGILEAENELRNELARVSEPPGLRVPLAVAMPQQALVRLRDTGLDLRELAMSVDRADQDDRGFPTQPDPVGRLVTALRDAGQASAAYGTEYLSTTQRPPEAMA